MTKPVVALSPSLSPQPIRQLLDLIFLSIRRPTGRFASGPALVLAATPVRPDGRCGIFPDSSGAETPFDLPDRHVVSVAPFITKQKEPC